MFSIANEKKTKKDPQHIFFVYQLTKQIYLQIINNWYNLVTDMEVPQKYFLSYFY